MDRYIALTPFGRDKFIQGGLPAAKIVVRPNSVHPDPGPGPGRGGFAVFVGRLDEQKGVRTLLRAWGRVGNRLPLRIIGQGPLAPLVGEVVRGSANVSWLGQLSRSETSRMIGEADLLVFCAESYEGQPRVIVEAFARGTPIVAPRLGAMAGMVDEGVTGRFFSAGDAESLAETILALLAERGTLARMRVAARRAFEESYEPTKATAALLEIYRAAIAACGDVANKGGTPG